MNKENEQKHCAQCGAIISIEDNFCENCGAKIVPKVQIRKEEAVVATSPAKETIKKEKIMKWFDMKEIKNRESLTPEQVNYIKKPSLTIFGPLNILFREHWDLLIILIIAGAYSAAEDNLMFSVFWTYSPIIHFIEWIISILFFYFAIFHGRRLAWNRNKWENFDKFKESEGKWMPWGIIMFILIIVRIFVGPK
ncbi:MAG: zinc ribbon domain-containing protein [Patescibacteria group bacterium]|nr:zinc ribbon domain-containing protein [Patescibacteria group bacterium]